MSWDELNKARAELGERLYGKPLTHNVMHKLLGTPLSTYNEWRPKGKVGELPSYAAAHIKTLLTLSKSVLKQRINEI